MTAAQQGKKTTITAFSFAYFSAEAEVYTCYGQRRMILPNDLSPTTQTSMRKTSKRHERRCMLN